MLNMDCWYCYCMVVLYYMYVEVFPSESLNCINNEYNCMYCSDMPSKQILRDVCLLYKEFHELRQLIYLGDRFKILTAVGTNDNIHVHWKCNSNYFLNWNIWCDKGEILDGIVWVSFIMNGIHFVFSASHNDIPWKHI